MKRTTAFILSLVGNILATCIWSLIILFMILVYLTPAQDPNEQNLVFGFLLTVIVMTAIALVFTWIGTFKLSGNQLWWAIFTIVIGSVFFFSPFFLPGILFIISGSISAAHYRRETEILS
ncbi:hypothetical protein E4665_08695 [Sporolactobacillus shoreae]|uniref:DUF4064 domain-containing protein n=1 Tax=Sporolactobacillus shoreae TaxID=1465501 RepID=A0A4Z0GQJ9_9BACL|nr:DUF4064 domain-containing protein [Sporolactobacillus shoreae]TGA98313.1 hypothetical protein E4665_08695 [Sporolactobacillus shoreae]